MTSRTVRQQQGVARRRQIIDVAVQLFGQQGFDGTTTRQIAEAAGITEGLVFHYFPTKADLLTAVLENGHSFIQELRAILTSAEHRSAPEVLTEIATGWLNTLRHEDAITRVLFGAAQFHPQVAVALQELMYEGRQRLSMYLRSRVEAGELREDLPVETSAHMFFASLIIFFISYRALPESEWQHRVPTFAHEQLDAWLYGAYRRNDETNKEVKHDGT